MVLVRDEVYRERVLEQGVLWNSLLNWATRRPDAPFLIEAETGRMFSYSQTLSGVEALRQVFGARPCRILLTLPGGIANALCWLSALSGGYHLIPASPDAPPRELLALARRYQPDFVLTESEESGASLAIPGAVILTRQMCEVLCSRTSFGSLREPREGCVSLTTSGSTGEPKGVLLRESQVAWAARQVMESHELTSQDRGLTALPFSHVNAPVVSLCASLLAGSTVVIARRFSRSQFWLWMERYQITWASLVPTIVAILLETERPAFLPGPLRFVRTGSAALPPANLLAFEERFGIPVIETYGLSEAGSQVVANPLPPASHKPGSAGRPTGVELRICEPRSGSAAAPLQDVSAGELGEICLRGPAVIHAYEGNAGQESFQDGWLRTGDLGYLDEDGYLFIRGRQREVINRGGENIAPREIEEVIQAFPQVREAAAVGRPDALYGEQVVAYLTVRERWSEEDLPVLRQHLRRHLSTPKLPVDLIILDELPRNATGKIDRRLLRAREQARAIGQNEERV